MADMVAALLVLDLLASLPQSIPDRPASAESPVPFAAGAATLFVPLALGSALFASADGNDTKRAAIYVMEGGFAAAPILSHMLARKWARAVAFGAVPVASAAGMVALLETSPDTVSEGDSGTRAWFFILLSLSVASSVVGVIDSGPSSGRSPARQLSMAPMLGARHAGLSVGGKW